MDYMNIILTGATNPNTIQFFTDYILREYKKAANEGLSKDEFFSGCRMFVGCLFDELERVYNYSLTVLPYCEHPESLNKWSCRIDLQRVSNGTHTGTMTGEDVYLILESFMDAEKLATTTTTTSQEPEPEQLKNPHPRIFKKSEYWRLFEHMRSKVRPQNELADYCFIYWSMTNDGYMYQIGAKEYKDWLYDTFGIDLAESWKQYNVCKTQNKQTIYNDAKQFIGLK